MKICIRCKIPKDNSEFYKDRQKKDGLTPYCKDCRKAKAKIQNDKNPQLARDRAKRLRSNNSLRMDLARMKMTVEQYDEKLSNQNQKCAICKQPETVSQSGKMRRLCVDHNHLCCPDRNACGKCNRGLLCARCNTMLGYAKDDIIVLNNAIQYLKEYILV